MIAFLKGHIAHKDPESLILEVNGVGYKAEISTTTFEQLPDEGEEAKLLIYHHFTENDQRLFGFYSSDEKELFELLITVKGVGPKLGLTILSGMPAKQTIQAILQSDKTALSSISGIGKKTAERMILELSDKITELQATTALAASEIVMPGDLKAEAISALQSLGFKKRDAETAVLQAAGDNGFEGDVQELVKKALTRLNK